MALIRIWLSVAIFISVAFCCVSTVRSAEALPANKVAAACNDFGFRLLRALDAGTDSNVIISPLGVSLVLTIAYNGASDATKTAMARTLALSSLSDNDINAGYNHLLAAARSGDPAVRVAIANALWARQGLAIRPDFIKRSRNSYGAEVKTLNFKGDPAGAAKTINTWTSRNTYGKIPEIVNDLSPRTVLMLTDAVYFKGKWTAPFDKKKTAPRRFFLGSQGSVTVPMMIQRGDYPYLETAAFQAIRLDYGDGRFAMYVFIPRKRTGVSYAAALSKFTKSLDEPNWSKWTGLMRKRPGAIIMPKFELRYGRNLRKALESIGLRIIFGPEANFSGIPVKPTPIMVSFFEHKTHIRVDEEGATAAAASAMGMLGSALQGRMTHPFSMIVDHPFFCAIAERKTGALMFIGVITDPSRENVRRAVKMVTAPRR
ncbi:MAG: serpin family protein [Candidatus Binataceae bacterium]